jgi:hypothetical protein
MSQRKRQIARNFRQLPVKYAVIAETAKNLPLSVNALLR